MKLEHHHRRIRRKALTIHLLMLPVAVVACVSWIYFALGVCDAGEGGALSACRYFSLLPYAPAAVGLLLAGLVAWDLASVGMDWHEENDGERPSRRLKHAHRGYRSIDDRHRRHVHLAAANILLVLLGLAAWLVYMARSTTR